MRFVKSQGAGNDFVMIEDLADEITLNAAFVAAVCDRHFGVGADGLIRVVRSERADLFMDYYNADGEVAEMCGNGVRCLAKYAADRGIVTGDTLSVDTRGGIKHLTLFRDEDGRVARVRVDMGAPIRDRALIPMSGEGDPLHQPIAIDDITFDAACVSMGNPHAVLFIDDLDTAPFHLGPHIETHPLFPAKTNVEFVEVRSTSEVRMRVWERGVGETMACGTGACAVAVATHARGLTGRTVAVHLPGGTLDIEVTDDTVFMTGPAEESFEGTLGARLTALLPQNERTR
jgi:diaminopimelate epimerase